MPVSRTRSLVTAALLAALLAASAWVSVPVGPVPITLQTFIVVIIALVCTPAQAAAAVGLYLLLGAVGIPVFSGARAGLAVLTGPTGGYLIGFWLAAVAGAWIARRPALPQTVAEAAAASVVLGLAYAPGTMWLAAATGRTLAEAAAVGVLPFVVFDIAKAAGAIAAVRALARAGVLASPERPVRAAGPDRRGTMPARMGDTVAVDYEGRLQDGTVFDSSAGRAPLLFTLGAGHVLPMFEAAVLDLEPGEAVTVTIPAEEAYGVHIAEAVQVVPVDVFGEGEPPIGGEFNVFGEDGESYTGRVVSISEDLVNVTVDFNHPLAGHALTYDITLNEIVPEQPEAAAEEQGADSPAADAPAAAGTDS